MATSTQKRTSTKQGSKQGSRSSGGSRKNGGSRQSQKQRPVRREVAGGVLLALSLFVFVSYFGVKALFIDLLSTLIKGLFGYGYWISGPALLLAG